MTSQKFSLPFILLSLENVETKGKNDKKLSISRIKNIFIVFEGLSFGEKMIKITDSRFKHIAEHLLRTNIANATKRSVLN